ncbi:RNA-binding protein 28-like [Tubulanus polymorphus]|uniref:RNA-binding protein 28-like n=1 Tax=Tubulanus polymorphus TaxID=672921 RepID=UPI003DA35542
MTKTAKNPSNDSEGVEGSPGEGVAVGGAAVRSTVSKNTLFVRNLHPKTTNEDLEKVFSSIGPMKQCFVVSGNNNRRGDSSDIAATPAVCRGFGYVTYSLPDDAQKALNLKPKLHGRPLVVVLADKKKKTKKKKKPTAAKDEEEIEDESVGENEEVEEKVAPPVGEKRNKKVSNKTYAVDVFCDAKINAKKFSKIENVENLAFERSTNQNRATLNFATKDAMIVAVKRLKMMKIGGKSLKVVLQKAISESESERKSRLIVRNLAFTCNEDLLRKTFRAFGRLTDARIPTRDNGRKFGFAFVQYGSTAEARRALDAMNGQSIAGRPVAVDWALAKSRYEESQQNDQAVASGDDDDDDDDDASDSEIANDDENGENDDNSSEDEEEMVSDEDAEIDSENDDQSSEDEKESDDESNSDEDDDDSMSDDDDYDDKRPREAYRSNDVEQGKTVFVKNLSYDSVEDDLDTEFEKFGEVEYSRIVVNPDTDKSRGTAFVKFLEKSAAERCIAAAASEDDDGITLDGRRLIVSVAISREKCAANDAAKKQEKRNKPSTDKRNLHLVREGMIRPGTRAAENLSKTDLAKRARLDAVKRAKLKNLNIFVSSTRLCVHNLPKRVGDAELRRTFKQIVPSARVTECRVMRDLKKLNASGVGQSLGYAFVALGSHDDALKALRAMNNNAELFGAEKRPIVEFSLENQAKLLAKEKRLERSKAKLAESSGKTANPRKGRVAGNQVVVPVPAADGAAAVSAGKMKKGLPSHWGPKIRHKPRGPQKLPEKPKGRPSRSELKRQTVEKSDSVPAQQREPKQRNGKRKAPAGGADSFDQLVNKYRQKFDTNSKTTSNKRKKSKWFE